MTDSADLAMANSHVALGERHIVRQREIIADFRRAGHPTALAEALLGSFEEVLATHLAHRDRILAALA
jgi:membrane glycosyltransferase